MRRHVYTLAKRQADYVCLTEEDYGASSDVTDAHALIFYYHNQWRILDVQESGLWQSNERHDRIRRIDLK